MVVLDMTILDPVFEQFTATLIRENNYTAHYHIMAVSLEQSNAFIEKRRSSTTHSEGGKIVHKETSNYFYDILPKGIEYLASVDKTNTALVWTAFDKQPTYVGNLTGSLKALEQGRAIKSELLFSEDELRVAKLAFLNNSTLL